MLGNKKVRFSSSAAPEREKTPFEKQLKTTKLKFILHTALLALSLLIFFAGTYTRLMFPDQEAEELFYYLMNGVGDSDPMMYIKALGVCIVPFLAALFALLLLQYDIPVLPKKYAHKGGRQLFTRRHRCLTTAVACTLCILLGFAQIGTFKYIAAHTVSSDFIEKNYVNPDGKVSAPESKRNLIVIEVESLETTFINKNNGGEWDNDVLRDMHDLLAYPGSTYFTSSPSSGLLRGTEEVYGTTWTTAALVGYNSGLPFKVPMNSRNKYQSDEFMGGAYMLGDILKASGYSNVLVSGSVTSFGGVKQMFTKHGEYDIIDAHSIASHGYSVPKSQQNEWGMSDEALFRIAKSECEKGLSGEKPFHLFISTIDTHIDCYTYDKEASEKQGYKGSETAYGTKYENAYATTAREIKAFVDWLCEQPEYANTTVVIYGDHLNMYKEIGTRVEDSSSRGRYNLILNSAVSSVRGCFGRGFTAFDFYPTVLAAAGFTVHGERLALGTNLFSGEDTLAERVGLEKMNFELERKSDFYNEKILGDDYFSLYDVSNGAASGGMADLTGSGSDTTGDGSYVSNPWGETSAPDPWDETSAPDPWGDDSSGEDSSSMIPSSSAASSEEPYTPLPNDFIGQQYVDPRGRVKLNGAKRNIVYIEVESLETTMFTRAQGGAWDYEVIPELYELLTYGEAVSFSADSSVRGGFDTYGTDYTVGAIAGYVTGLPLKLKYSGRSDYYSDKFMDGAYALGDVTLANGYRNLYVSGSVTYFGGLKKLFRHHGSYEIIEPGNVGKYGYKVPGSQRNEWGMSDEAAFRIAKSEWEKHFSGGSSEPLHLFISTIDTHIQCYTYDAAASAADGYTGSVNRFVTTRENSYATTAREIKAFVDWLRTTPQYANTTIVIVGDHYNMASDFCDTADKSLRGKYNVILNPVTAAAKTKNRSFAAMDFYPTVLAACGFTFGGDRLALGTNLFSETETLYEQYGIEEVKAELRKRSDFVIKRIFRDVAPGSQYWEIVYYG